MSRPIEEPHREIGLAAHIVEVQSNERASFHMPGHKGGRGAPPLGRSLLGDAVYAADLSELSGFDYLHGADSALMEAQQRAANIFGAEQTWFLVNGATVGNIAAICAVVGDNEKILVARASHRSVYAGIAMSGAQPVYLAPVRNRGLDGLYGVGLCDVERALRDDAGIRAIHVTNPSYYGFTVPLSAIAALAHDHDIPLIVDEAHGTHFVFNDAFPSSALSCGADLVVQSPHKTLGSLTQSSLLHRQGSRIQATKVQALLGMLQSSSPSALLLVSLDLTINEMAINGAEQWGQALDLAQGLREAIADLSHIRVYRDEIIGTDGIFGYDPAKIVIDVEGIGTTGFAAGRWLREHWQVNPEFSDLRRMVFSITVGDTKEQTELLIEALDALSTSQYAFDEHPSVTSHWPTNMPTSRVSPRLVQQAQDTSVDASAAVGRIAAEMIVPYPPGVPLLAAGEEITEEILRSMDQLVSAGCHLVGIADTTGKTLRVLV